MVSRLNIEESQSQKVHEVVFTCLAGIEEGKYEITGELSNDKVTSVRNQINTDKVVETAQEMFDLHPEDIKAALEVAIQMYALGYGRVMDMVEPDQLMYAYKPSEVPVC